MNWLKEVSVGRVSLWAQNERGIYTLAVRTATNIIAATTATTTATNAAISVVGAPLVTPLCSALVPTTLRARRIRPGAVQSETHALSALSSVVPTPHTAVHCPLLLSSSVPAPQTLHAVGGNVGGGRVVVSVVGGGGAAVVVVTAGVVLVGIRDVPLSDADTTEKHVAVVGSEPVRVMPTPDKASPTLWFPFHPAF